MDPSRVAVRLAPEDRAALIDWAYDRVKELPALKGKLFRIDGSPRMSTILRHAALSVVPR